MFRISEILIEDKKLSEFLKRCAGLVEAMEFPQPVVNAEVSANGEIKEASSGRSDEMFYRHARRNHWSKFTNTDVKDFLVSIGRSGGSGPYVTGVLKKRGLIKQTTAHGGHYEIVKKEVKRGKKA